MFFSKGTQTFRICQNRKHLLKTFSACHNAKKHLQNCYQFCPFIRNNSSASGSQSLNHVEVTQSCIDGTENTASSTDNLEAITKGDKELEHKLKVIMLEVEVLRQAGKAVPENDVITTEMWEYLLNLPSRSGRTKYLEFLFKVSKKKEKKLEKKMAKRKEHEEIMSKKEPNVPLPVEEHALKYGLQHNNIFIRFSESTMNRFYNRKLIEAVQFGQKLVIDCGYDKDMTKRENTNTAKQIMLLFAENRSHDEPFDIHYSNLNRDSDITKTLNKFIPTMYDKEFPMNIHENSYLDIFPKERLIYLTPHCREEMTSFDHEAVYIIGAIVDKINNEPISLAKAKREGLTMMKFPLDRYLQWGGGSGKSLTINQCVSILLDLKSTGDWNYALRHVPRRKIVDPDAELSGTKPYSSQKRPFAFGKKQFNYDKRSFPFEQKGRWKPDNRSKSFDIKIKSLYED